MGGRGSGNFWQSQSVTRAEGAKRIDIRYLRKSNLLKANSAGSLWWTDGNGDRTGSISYTVFDDELWLRYWSEPYGHERRDMSVHVPLVETKCHFGGHRKWFLCPRCNGRVAILYANWYDFVCRKCAGVKHSSNLEGYMDRLTRKARKIRHKLDIGDTDIFNPDSLMDWPVYKPKGMHQKTFDRLVDEETRLQEQIDNAFLVRFGHYL